MTVNKFNIGKTQYGRVFAEPFEKWSSIPQGALYSFQLRYGLKNSINYMAGQVIRGVDFDGFVDRVYSDGSSQLTITLAPGATHNNLRTTITPSISAKTYYEIKRPTSSIPLGRFGSQPGEVNLNQWGGMSTESMIVITTPPPANASIGLNKYDFYCSAPPGWQVLGPSTLAVSQTGAKITLRVAYSDEPVVGLAVEFRSSTGVCSMQNQSGNWFGNVEYITDGQGQIQVPIRADKAGGDAIIVRCSDPRSSPVYFAPPLDTLVSINSSAAVIGGVNCVVTPYVAAVPTIPGRSYFNNNDGWNAGANSLGSISGNLEVALKMDPVIGVVVGFAGSLENVQDFNRMTHAFYFSFVSGRPTAQIMESGRVRALAHAGYDADMQFRIRRVGTTVKYYLNGSLLYTSLVPSAGAVTIGSSLYGTGDSI